MDEYLTTQDIASLFRVSERTIYNWEVKGKLVPVKQEGTKKKLYSKADIENIIKLSKKPTHKNIKISFANQKGGVGKSIGTFNVAGGLARKGFKVLCIDMDSQANLTSCFFSEYDENDDTIYKAITNKISFQKIVKETKYENIFLIPSAIDLANAEKEWNLKYKPYEMLNQYVENITEYDFILVDTPPSLGILTGNVLAACDYVIIPIQTEYFSLLGTNALVRTINEIKEELNERLELLCVYPSRVDMRIGAHKDAIKDIRKAFGDRAIDGQIRNLNSIAISPSKQETIFEFDGNSSGARDFDTLVDGILRRLEDEQE